jgi:hypothetical protein
MGKKQGSGGVPDKTFLGSFGILHGNLPRIFRSFPMESTQDLKKLRMKI